MDAAFTVQVSDDVEETFVLHAALVLALTWGSNQYSVRETQTMVRVAIRATPDSGGTTPR